MQIVFGIDFGTTNSALSVRHYHGVELVALDDLQKAGNLMRSMLYFSEEQDIFSGNQAAYPDIIAARSLYLG